MPPRGFRTLTVKSELYEALLTEYGRRYKKEDRLKPKFTVWVSELLWKEVEKK